METKKKEFIQITKVVPLGQLTEPVQGEWPGRTRSGDTENRKAHLMFDKDRERERESGFREAYGLTAGATSKYVYGYLPGRGRFFL